MTDDPFRLASPDPDGSGADRPEIDALASPRVAADLCGVPTARVAALIRSGAVRSTTIRGETMVNIRDVEHAIAEEGRRDDTA